MTSSEAAAQLDLGRGGAHALSELCRKGCDPGSLCALVIRLTGPPVTIRPRPQASSPRQLPRITGSGLKITGGFAPVPEKEAAFARADSEPSSVPRSSVDSREVYQGKKPARLFQSRELVALSRQMIRRTAVEYVDKGVSGSKDRRPALDALIKDAKRRRFDVLVCWRLDRLGRNLRHLITLLDELQALGVAFVSLAEGIDATTPAGKLQMHILGAIAEFERARIAERVRAGLARARANGQRLGQKPLAIPSRDLDRTAHLSIRRAAAELGISRSVLHRARLSRGPTGIAVKKGQ